MEYSQLQPEFALLSISTIYFDIRVYHSYYIGWFKENQSMVIFDFSQFMLTYLLQFYYQKIEE